MTKTIHCAALAILSIGVVTMATRSSAQQSSDEQTIRDLIAKRESGQRVAFIEDRVGWSAPYRRPSRGNEPAIARIHMPGERQLSNRVDGTDQRVTVIHKIEFSASHDMAWEYSDSMFTTQLKNGEKPTVPTSTLRVWQKVGGEWKIAAYFTLETFND